MPQASVCFFNGELVPETEAVVPVQELGQQIIYDTARTYQGEPRTIELHMNRLFHGCHYFGFDLGMREKELAESVRQVVAANRDSAFVANHGDYLINTKISGAPLVHMQVVSMETLFRERARFFREGVRTVTASSQRHIPPQCIDPRLKIPRPWFQLAIRETRMNHPDCWEYPLMLDLDGNLTEFAAGNLFLVIEGELHTPAKNVLMGCSRHIIIEVARQQGIPCHERDLTLWDLYNADEAIMTGTTYGLLPIATVNSVRIGPHAGFGPLSQRLHDGFSDYVGINLQAQYEHWL